MHVRSSVLDMWALRRLLHIRVDPFKHPREIEGLEFVMLHEVATPGMAVT